MAEIDWLKVWQYFCFNIPPFFSIVCCLESDSRQEEIEKKNINLQNQHYIESGWEWNVHVRFG